MVEQCEIQPTTVNIDRKKKMPLDARIVGWLVLTSAFIGFLCVGLLVIGLAHNPSDYHRPVLFGTVSLTSDLSLGIHTFLSGLVCLISGYGLIKGHKFGWWLTLILSIDNISDSLLIFSDYRITASIGIYISIGIIIWLVWRRGFYGIGKTSYV